MPGTRRRGFLWAGGSADGGQGEGREERLRGDRYVIGTGQEECHCLVFRVCFEDSGHPFGVQLVRSKCKQAANCVSQVETGDKLKISVCHFYFKGLTTTSPPSSGCRQICAQGVWTRRRLPGAFKPPL